MKADPASVRLRLSATQMSVIWPGLDRIVRQYSGWSARKESLYTYPFRMYPPLPGFDRGTYNADLMDGIVNLSRRLRSKARAGCRTHMTSIDLRAAIFAVRVNTSWWQYQKVIGQKLEARTKEVMQIDPDTLKKLMTKSARTILSLERHTKRADYRLGALVSSEDYIEYMDSWKAHLRWIRLHLVYFKPLRPHFLKGRKGSFQIILNELIEVAKEMISAEGLLPPKDGELRRIMRLYSCSSRRFREGHYTVPYVINHRSSEYTRWHLVEFIQKRITLRSAAPA